jgi:hypothetical protein
VGISGGLLFYFHTRSVNGDRHAQQTACVDLGRPADC